MAFSLDGEALAADLRAAGPKVHTRARWRAKAPKRKAELLNRAPDRIVVHHTATPNATDYSVAHAYLLSRTIQRFHMQTRRWDDIGEQLTISRGGHVMEGRNRSLTAIRAGKHVVGAQALNHNRHTIGIENEGTYMRASVPGRLWSSLVETCSWLCRVYDLDPYRAILGHRDLGATDCPGDVLYRRLPELRRTVASRLRIPKPPVVVPPDIPLPDPPTPDAPLPGTEAPEGDLGSWFTDGPGLFRRD